MRCLTVRKNTAIPALVNQRTEFCLITVTRNGWGKFQEEKIQEKREEFHVLSINFTQVSGWSLNVTHTHEPHMQPHTAENLSHRLRLNLQRLELQPLQGTEIFEFEFSSVKFLLKQQQQKQYSSLQGTRGTPNLYHAWVPKWRMLTSSLSQRET